MSTRPNYTEAEKAEIKRLTGGGHSTGLTAHEAYAIVLTDKVVHLQNLLELANRTVNWNDYVFPPQFHESIRLALVEEEKAPPVS